MLSKMLNTTIELKDKYAAEPWKSNTIARDLVKIIDSYIPEIENELLFEESIAAEAAAHQA